MSVSSRRNVVSVCLLAASLLPAQARAQNWSFDARTSAWVAWLDQQRRRRHGRRAAAVSGDRAAVRTAPGDSQFPSSIRPATNSISCARSIRATRFTTSSGATTRDRLCFHHRPSQRQAEQRSQRLPGILAGTSVSPKVWLRRAGVTRLSSVRIQRFVSGRLHWRRTVSLDADVSHHRPGAGRRICQFHAGLTPNTSFYMSNDTLGQLALAVTDGYRARIGRAGGGELDGLYIGANYHYLHGFRYENFEPDARLDTNAQGLLTINPSRGSRHDPPHTSSEGSGWPSTWVSQPLSIDGRSASASTGLPTESSGQMSSAPTTCSTASSPAATSSTFHDSGVTHAWNSR